ncbi:hypothetical protein KAS31_03700 [Candidatus Parcubacteria bacterium]|nr:hypothetical protein [Candidatus Parcubacteria bacterium]
MKLINKVTLIITALLVIASTVVMISVFFSDEILPSVKAILVGVYLGLMCLTAWLFGAGYLTPGEENLVVDKMDDI